MSDEPRAERRRRPARPEREARHRGAARRHRDYRPRRKGWHWREQHAAAGARPVRVPRDVSKPLERSIPLPAAHYFGNIDPQPDCVRHHRDRLRALRGRHPPHAHGRLARRRPHDGHPHRRPEPHRRPARGHARGRRRHRRHAQAAARHSARARPDRGRGRPADQLPLLRERRGRPRDRRHVRRGGRERRPPGPAVQRALPQHQHVPQLRGRGRGQARHGERRHRCRSTARTTRTRRPSRPGRSCRSCSSSTRSTARTPWPSACPRRTSRCRRCRRTRRRRRACAWTCRTRSRCATSSATTRCARSRTRATWSPTAATPPSSHVMNLLISPAHQRRHPVHDHARRGPQRALALQQRARPSTRPSSRSWAWTACARWSSSTGRTPSSRPRCASSRSARCSSSRRCCADGGYFAAVEEAYFVDSGEYPETNDDGIARKADGGVAAGHHRRARRRLHGAGLPPLRRQPPAGGLRRGGRRGRRSRRSGAKPCDLIGGCTLCDPTKVPFIDELDPEDNVNVRLAQTARAARQGAHQAGGRVGRRRHRRGHACSCRRPSGSPRPPRSRSARR